MAIAHSAQPPCIRRKPWRIRTPSERRQGATEARGSEEAGRGCPQRNALGLVQYREHAWGKDQIKPLSGGFESFPLKNHHLGLSLIEALDTLWIMGLDEEFAEGVDWVKSDLSFDVDGEVSVFETAIRLARRPAFRLARQRRSRASRQGSRSRRPFDAQLRSVAAGIPHRFINLKTGALRGTETNPAETGTFLPEFGILSQGTGDDRYRAAAKKALVSMFERRSKIGLLADSIDCMIGEWKSRRATIGPPSDSYYEYLWDGWDLLRDRDCLAMYQTLTTAILQHHPARPAAISVPRCRFRDRRADHLGPG